MRRTAAMAMLVALLVGSWSLAGQELTYDVRIDVDWQRGGFDGEATIDWRNDTGETLDELFFRIYANAYSIYGPARIDVNRVEVDGLSVEPVGYLGDTVLLVPLSVPLEAGQTISVRMSFSGKPADIRGRETDPDLGYGLLTRGETTLVLTAFHPILAPYTDEGWVLDPVVGHGDALFAETADYVVRVTVDGTPDAYATGDLVSAAERGMGKEYLFHATGARDFSLVLAEGLDVFEQSVDGGIVRAAFGSAEAGQMAALRAAQSMRVFETRIGALPYREIELVEVPLHRVAGVELTGLILVSSAYAQSPNERFFSVIVTHEMAHQWFYAAIGNDLFEHPWLDEGLATYLSYVAIGEVIGESAEAEEMRASQAAYAWAAEQYPDLGIGSPLHRFPDSSVYSAFVYSGGATWCDAVRSLVGDDAFFAGLASYYETGIGRVAVPADLFGALEAACDCDLTGLFAAFGLLR